MEPLRRDWCSATHEWQHGIQNGVGALALAHAGQRQFGVAGTDDGDDVVGPLKRSAVHGGVVMHHHVHRLPHALAASPLEPLGPMLRRKANEHLLVAQR